MSNIGFSSYFILLEGWFGNSPGVTIDIVIALEVALFHVSILAHGWAPAACALLITEIGMEKEIPAVNLIVPPLPNHKVPIIFNSDPQTFEGRLRFAGTVL